MYKLSSIISHYLYDLIRIYRIRLCRDVLVRLAILFKSDFSTAEGKKTTFMRIVNIAYMLTFAEWEVLKREYHPHPHPIPCNTG